MNARTIRQVLALALATFFLLTFIPNQATADPYIIDGYLKDSEGIPITLAEISLTGSYYNYSVDPYNPTLKEYTMTVETDNTGYFRITPEVGMAGYVSDLVLSYDSGDNVVSRTIVVHEGERGTWANLTYEESASISDILFSPVGFVSIVVIVSVIFILFYMNKTSKEEAKEKKDSRNVGRRRR